MQCPALPDAFPTVRVHGRCGPASYGLEQHGTQGRRPRLDGLSSPFCRSPFTSHSMPAEPRRGIWLAYRSPCSRGNVATCSAMLTLLQCAPHSRFALCSAGNPRAPATAHPTSPLAASSGVATEPHNTDHGANQQAGRVVRRRVGTLPLLVLSPAAAALLSPPASAASLCSRKCACLQLPGDLKVKQGELNARGMQGRGTAGAS